jgi:hypothetical protein
MVLFGEFTIAYCVAAYRFHPGAVWAGPEPIASHAIAGRTVLDNKTLLVGHGKVVALRGGRSSNAVLLDASIRTPIAAVVGRVLSPEHQKHSRLSRYCPVPIA